MIREAAYYLAESRSFEAGHELEDWLAAAPEPDRPVLLRELFRLELHYRRHRGECPTAQ